MTVLFKKKTKLWTMKDGNKIRICDMDDNHLNNTIAMLEKKARRKVQNALTLSFKMEGMLHGDMALLSVETEQNCLMDDDAYEQFVPDIYWDMLDDKIRRENLND